MAKGRTPDDLLNDAEVAELMRLSTRHFRFLARTGKLSSALVPLQVGSRRRWHRPEVEAWLRGGK